MYYIAEDYPNDSPIEFDISTNGVNIREPFDPSHSSDYDNQYDEYYDYANFDQGKTLIDFETLDSHWS